MEQKRKKITLKQAKLLEGIIAGKTMTQSALDAKMGTTPESAAACGSRALRNANVQENLRIEMEAAGLSVGCLVNHLKRGLNESKMGHHDVYLKLGMQAHGLMNVQEQATDSIMTVLAGHNANQSEVDKFADIIIAVRLSRGLSPTDNKRIPPEEVARFSQP